MFYGASRYVQSFPRKRGSRSQKTGLTPSREFHLNVIFKVMAKFSDTVTFITGASSGIGAALTLEIAHQGGDVVLVARRQERLQELIRKIESMERRALAVPCDVSSDDDLKRAVEKTKDEFGRIDYVVANAGFGVAGLFEKLTVDDFRRQFETNVFGVLKTIYATRECLVASRGCLGIIGSINGYIATPRLSAYSMSKFAIHGLAESLLVRVPAPWCWRCTDCSRLCTDGDPPG